MRSTLFDGPSLHCRSRFFSINQLFKTSSSRQPSCNLVIFSTSRSSATDCHVPSTNHLSNPSLSRQPSSSSNTLDQNHLIILLFTPTQLLSNLKPCKPNFFADTSNTTTKIPRRMSGFICSDFFRSFVLAFRFGGHFFDAGVWTSILI